MRGQSLAQQIGLLTIDLNVLRLVVVKMLAETLRSSEQPDDGGSSRCPRLVNM
jgi:hypothetical protein